MKLLFIINAVILVLAQVVAADKKIVCYWANWSVYRPGDGNFLPTNLDPKLCTHLIYTFVGLDSNTDEVFYLDLASDIPHEKNSIVRFNQLREQNPELKTMVAIGGWIEGSLKYSRMAADPNRRRKFVESAYALVKKHGFDGFDVDWEYPGQRDGSPADKQNYVLLLKELRERFEQDGLLLSAAVAASESSASKSYNIPEISKYLDFINIMAYDFHSSYDRRIGFHSAIYPASSESSDDKKLNVEGTINYWLSQGAPAEKLILGVPFYGRSFTVSNPQTSSHGTPASAGAAGPYTKENGNLGYNEICEKIKNENWQVKYDEERRVPYAFGANQWVSYDDQQSLKEKADFIKKYNLGGAMVWGIETDDFRGKCGEKFPLLKTLNSELRNGVFSEPSESRPKGETPKSQPQYQLSQHEPNNSQHQPDYSQQYPDASYTQPKHPQQQANNGQICQAQEYVRNPNDCSKYHYCQSYNGGFVQLDLSCSPGLYYNKQGYCDWPQNVQC